VAENIDLPLSYKNLPVKERQGMVADILDRFQIVAKKDLYPTSSPAGSSNWWHARAVVHAPTLLLADEPTGNCTPRRPGDHGAIPRTQPRWHDYRAGDAFG